MTKIQELASRIIALYFALSDVHYLALKARRWDVHKLADKMRGPLITEWVDAIQESHAVPMEGNFYAGRELLAEAVKYAPKAPETLDAGLDAAGGMMLDLLDLIDGINRPKGTDNMVSGFAQDLQQYLGWIGETTKEK